MAARQLNNLRILIVDDEYLLADELRDRLIEAGAEVLEPALCVHEALETIAEETVDVVLLDIGLGREISFPVADELDAIKVPFIFYTSHRPRILPDRFADSPFLAKSADFPVLAAQINWVVERAIMARASSGVVLKMSS